MSENAPFLAKFAKSDYKQVPAANSNSEKRTVVTRVARETTDDR